VSQLSDLRRDYALAALTEREVDADPIRQFRQWYAEADAANLAIEPNAMTLATATADGAPSARMVLLRGFDERGFVFFTDYRSRKGEELTANARAALVFYWAELERQVRIAGTVVQVTAEESDAYFRTRPALSQLSALASHQSHVIANRSRSNSGRDGRTGYTIGCGTGATRWTRRRGGSTVCRRKGGAVGLSLRARRAR
jgi:pyridoxamine 5'-phosphate oxidase